MLATQALTYGPIFNEKLTQAAWEMRAVAHVVATRDQTLAAALQEANARNTGGRVTQIPTGHMVPLQAPSEVAAAVIALCEAALH
jgi:pimeloyl-ACP methyl ester carboxylesterase